MKRLPELEGVREWKIEWPVKSSLSKRPNDLPVQAIETILQTFFRGKEEILSDRLSVSSGQLKSWFDSKEREEEEKK